MGRRGNVPRKGNSKINVRTNWSFGGGVYARLESVYRLINDFHASMLCIFVSQHLITKLRDEPPYPPLNFYCCTVLRFKPSGLLNNPSLTKSLFVIKHGNIPRSL